MINQCAIFNELSSACYLRGSAVKQHGWFSAKKKFSRLPIMAHVTLLNQDFMLAQTYQEAY